MIHLLRRTKPPVKPLVTARLQLIAITPALLHSEAESKAQLARMLQVKLACDWPPDLWEASVRAHIGSQLTTKPETLGWHRYMVLVEPERLLVGCVGAFPCAAGDVELGYSVAASYQRQGLATEAADRLITWLLTQPAIHSVSAQAFENVVGSIKVMQHCGMHWAGTGEQPGTVRYRRWR